MGFSKEQVKDHIFGVESRVTNHEEVNISISRYMYEYMQASRYADLLYDFHKLNLSSCNSVLLILFLLTMVMFAI